MNRRQSTREDSAEPLLGIKVQGTLIPFVLGRGGEEPIHVVTPGLSYDYKL